MPEVEPRNYDTQKIPQAAIAEALKKGKQTNPETADAAQTVKTLSTIDNNQEPKPQDGMEEWNVPDDAVVSFVAEPGDLENRIILPPKQELSENRTGILNILQVQEAQTRNPEADEREGVALTVAAFLVDNDVRKLIPNAEAIHQKVMQTDFSDPMSLKELLFDNVEGGESILSHLGKLSYSDSPGIAQEAKDLQDQLWDVAYKEQEQLRAEEVRQPGADSEQTSIPVEAVASVETDAEMRSEGLNKEVLSKIISLVEHLPVTPNSKEKAMKLLEGQLHDLDPSKYDQQLGLIQQMKEEIRINVKTKSGNEAHPLMDVLRVLAQELPPEKTQNMAATEREVRDLAKGLYAEMQEVEEWLEREAKKHNVV